MTGATAEGRRRGLSNETADCTRDAFLGGKVMLRQPRRGYRAGLDAVLLAAAVPAGEAAGRHVLDAGSGVGTVGLCLAARIPNAQVTLVERAPPLVNLARENISDNGLTDRVRIIQTDMTDGAGAHAAAGLRPDTFDIVVANPPYQVAGRGRRPANDIKAAANEMRGEDLDAWMRTLARVARPDGRLFLIHRVDALDDVLAALKGRFGAIEIVPVHPHAGRDAKRILVIGRKGSRAALTIRAGIVLHDAITNAYLPEIDVVLKEGAGLTLAPKTLHAL